MGGSTTGREPADFRQQTVQTRILDTELGVYHSVYGDLGYGEQTVLSLATAIDMLWPCHWDFVQNLENVPGVIGGDPSPRRPFAFSARNIKLSPVRERMRIVSHTLRVFCQERPPDDDVDAELLTSLGEPSSRGRWLAASLDKTIRLQMDLWPTVTASKNGCQEENSSLCLRTPGFRRGTHPSLRVRLTAPRRHEEPSSGAS